MTTARAALLFEPRSTVEIHDVDIPPLDDDEVLVRVAATGVCHSDLLPIEGQFTPSHWPIQLGHEGVGYVEAVGDRVARTKPGDRVVVSFVPSCGACWWCARGESHLCATHGTGLVHQRPRAFIDGDRPVYTAFGVATFAELTKLGETYVIPIESDLPDDQLALVSCSLATGVCAVLNTAAVRAGDSVAVVGLGGVGLAAVQGARLAGAETIVGIDPLPDRRAAAASLGATTVLDPFDGSPVKTTRLLTGGRGVDHAFEAAGRADAAALGYRLIRRGGKLVLLGAIPPHEAAAWTPADQTAAGKQVLGSVFGSAQVRRDFPMLVSLIEAGRLDVSSIISAHVPLNDINTALRGLQDGSGIRSVVVP